MSLFLLVEFCQFCSLLFCQLPGVLDCLLRRDFVPRTTSQFWCGQVCCCCRGILLFLLLLLQLHLFPLRYSWWFSSLIHFWGCRWFWRPRGHRWCWRPEEIAAHVRTLLTQQLFLLHRRHSWVVVVVVGGVLLNVVCENLKNILQLF